MKSFSKRPFSILGSIFIIAIFVGMTCCTEVDDRLGLNFIPGDQKMKVYQEYFGIEADQRIRSYTQVLDSIQASGMNTMMLGKIKDDKFGKAQAASIFQMLPPDPDTYFEDGDGYAFGEIYIADSLIIEMQPVYLAGDETKEQTFTMYALTDTLIVNKTYYQAFDYTPIKSNTPLFTFKLSGKYTEAEYITANATSAGKQFLKDLLADTTLYYENRPLFRNKFKGFVVEPDTDSPDDAAVYTVDLASSYTYLQYHIMESGSSVPKDTTYVKYYTNDALAADSVSNVSFVKLTHDYSGTPIEQALTLTESMTPQSVTYIDGFNGVTTMVEFPDEFFEAILAKRIVDGEEADMSFNQAQLFIQLEDDDTDIMNASFQKLGSYYDFRKDETIPDYSLLDEYGSSSSNSYYAYYGGKLNRTFGYYSLNITTFLHYAVKMYEKKKAKEKFDENYMKLTLGPTSHYVYPVTKLEDYGRTSIKGIGSDAPMKLRLTYTLITKK